MNSKINAITTLEIKSKKIPSYIFKKILLLLNRANQQEEGKTYYIEVNYDEKKSSHKKAFQNTKDIVKYLCEKNIKAVAVSPRKTTQENGKTMIKVYTITQKTKG